MVMANSPLNLLNSNMDENLYECKLLFSKILYINVASFSEFLMLD